MASWQSTSQSPTTNTATTVSAAAQHPGVPNTGYGGGAINATLLVFLTFVLVVGVLIKAKKFTVFK
jgi:hypothetical protein